MYLGGRFLVVVLYNIVSILTPFHFHASDITCYMVGFLMAEYRIENKKKTLTRICYLSVTLALLINVYILFAKIYLNADFVNDEFYYWLWAYGHSVLGLAIFSVMLVLCKNLRENRLTRLSDLYSYEIYLVHHFFLLSPLSLLLLPLPFYYNVPLSVIAISLTAYGLKQIEIRILEIVKK